MMRATLACEIRNLSEDYITLPLQFYMELDIRVIDCT